MFFCCVLFLSVEPLYSQAPRPPSQANVERATREVERLGRDEDVAKKFRKPPSKPTSIKVEKPPVKKEGPKFFIKQIKLAGTESYPPEEFKFLVEKYENKEDTMDDISGLCREIEREYLKRGIIAACYPPPQDVKEGTLTLQIIEAKMGVLDVEKRKEWYFNKDMVAFYWSLKPGEVLRYDKISRSLYLMNKNPDRQVRATLHAGKKPQTTDVLLTPDVKFPIHLTASFDREGAYTTGRERKGIGIKDNNFLFADDTAIWGYTYGDHFSGVYAYHKIPLTDFGTSFMYGYSSSRSNPVKDFERFGIDARSLDAIFNVYQDIFDKSEYLGEVYGGLNTNDKSVKWNINGTTTRDRLRVLKVGGNFVFRSPISVTYINPEFSEGINGLGAERRSPLSSRVAENTFSRSNFSARHTTIWPLDIQTNLIFKGQLADKKLMPQEEFALGGIDSVRGYAWGDYQADNAVQANLEFLFPAFMIPKDLKIPYVFARPVKDYFSEIIFLDYGYGEKRGLRVDQGEKDNAQFVGIGAGIRVRLLNQGLLRLEWGFPVGNTPITEGAKTKGRFHFSIDLEDHMPEEIERIRKTLNEENAKVLAWNLLNNELNRPASPLRAKFDNYQDLAEEAYRAGDFEKAKEYYEKTYAVGTSLYRQSENYVKKYAERKKELAKDSEIALQYFRNGEVEKAREMWRKIIDGAATQPLVLEF